VKLLNGEIVKWYIICDFRESLPAEGLPVACLAQTGRQAGGNQKKISAQKAQRIQRGFFKYVVRSS